MIYAQNACARNEPDWSHIHAELKRRGVTLALLWQEYRAEHAQGYARAERALIFADKI